MILIGVVLLNSLAVQGIKKCQRIDSCRCSTDEGEINLWSLASRTPNLPRYGHGTFTFNVALVLGTSSFKGRVSSVHWINHYSLDSSVDFGGSYPTDSDLSPDRTILPLSNWNQICVVKMHIQSVTEALVETNKKWKLRQRLCKYPRAKVYLNIASTFRF